MPFPVGIGTIIYNHKDMLSNPIGRSGADPHARSIRTDK
jgi:hypothetical protein